MCQCGYVIVIVVGGVVDLYFYVVMGQFVDQFQVVVYFRGDGDEFDGGQIVEIIYLFK